MAIKWHFILGCLLWLISLSGKASMSLSVLAEEDFPPYSYVEASDSSGVEGLAVRMVKELLHRLGEPDAIELQPWIRAYRSALDKPNVLIFPIRRTEEREKHFYWIGVIAPYQMSVYAKTPELRELVSNLVHARKFRVGTLNGGYVESELVKQGFEVGINLFQVSRMVQNVQKLMDDRIDLLPIGDLSMAYILDEYYKEADELPYPLFRFSANQDEQLYLALSLKTPVRVVERLTEALSEMHKDGSYTKILNDYLEESGLLTDSTLRLIQRP